MINPRAKSTDITLFTVKTYSGLFLTMSHKHQPTTSHHTRIPCQPMTFGLLHEHIFI